MKKTLSIAYWLWHTLCSCTTMNLSWLTFSKHRPLHAAVSLAVYWISCNQAASSYKQVYSAVLNGSENIWATVLFGNGSYFSLLELGDQATWNKMSLVSVQCSLRRAVLQNIHSWYVPQNYIVFLI